MRKAVSNTRTFDVARQPIKGTLLEEIAMRLNLPLSELLRESNAGEMPDLGNDSDYIKVIQHNPGILCTPIAISGTKTIIVESPGDLSKM